MTVIALRANVSLDAEKPAVAELKDDITNRLAAIRKMNTRGFCGGYKRALDEVNAKIDEYMHVRTLTLVRSK